VKAKNILDIIDWIKSLFQEKGGKKKEIVYKYKYRPAEETVEEEVVEPDQHEKTGTGDEKVKHEKDNDSPENDDKTDAECEKEEIGGNGKDAGK
jgi:hypothetical protein